MEVGMRSFVLNLDDDTAKLVEWAAADEGERPEQWMVDAIEAWLGEMNSKLHKDGEQL